MLFEYQGKMVFNGKTVEGFFHMIDGKTYITPFGTAVAKEVVPETVRVFVGQKDRNGKKIHAYDALRFCIDEPEEDICDCDYVVLWDAERCGFYVNWVENADEWDHIDAYFCANCEVIGNTLDNPALAGVHCEKIEAAKSQSLADVISEVGVADGVKVV